ncbi:MAG: anti-sigma factor domain-containing protein [Aquaticitalea sp.]
METTLQTLINSGLIDKYILGETSIAESMEIEHYISEYPEIENEYNRLQDNLEIIAKSNSVEAPKHVLASILKEIEEKPVISMSQTTARTPWYSIAASFTAIAFAVMAFLLYQKNMVLINENQVVVEEIFDLRSDIDKYNSKLDNVMFQFQKLNNPETEKYVLRGNSRAKNLKTVAYINSIDKTSMIDIVELPTLPAEQQYEMWAEFQDRMVSLGILDANDRSLKSIPYMENALGLSITIENKNNAKNKANAENSVAEISLKNKKDK